MNQTNTGTASDVPSSPEDGGNFRRNLEIDMKGLIGDAVGNVSRPTIGRSATVWSLAEGRGIAAHNFMCSDEHKSRKPRRCVSSVRITLWNVSLKNA